MTISRIPKLIAGLGKTLPARTSTIANRQQLTSALNSAPLQTTPCAPAPRNLSTLLSASSRHIETPAAIANLFSAFGTTGKSGVPLFSVDEAAAPVDSNAPVSHSQDGAAQLLGDIEAGRVKLKNSYSQKALAAAVNAAGKILTMI